MSYLYRLDFASGKSYIGITEGDVSARFKQHAACVRRGQHTVMWDAWRKHGAPRLVILMILETSILQYVEQRAIAKFKTLLPDGYNMTPGGEISPTSMPSIAAKLRGQKRSPEVCAKMAVARRRWRPTPEHVAKIAAANRGKKRSEATRALLSVRALNRNPVNHYTPFGIKFSRERRIAHCQTMRRPEVRAKISAAKRGKTISRRRTTYKNKDQLYFPMLIEPLPGWEKGER